jgi:hypothetical protein
MKLTEEQRAKRRSTREYNRKRRAKIALAHAIIDSGYVQQARKMHPDAGGSHEQMIELQEVRQRLHDEIGDGKRLRPWWHPLF